MPPARLSVMNPFKNEYRQFIESFTTKEIELFTNYLLHKKFGLFNH